MNEPFLLIFPSNSRVTVSNSRVCKTFDSLEECFEQLLTSFEELLEKTAVTKELTYDAADLMTYIDEMTGIKLLEYDPVQSVYIPKGVEFIQNRLYKFVQEKAM